MPSSVRSLLGWLLRGIRSLGILISGALWFLGIEIIIAGLWLQNRPLYYLGVTLIVMLAGLHMVLDAFPMRWFSRLVEWGLRRRTIPAKKASRVVDRPIVTFNKEEDI
jgi:hypothetical protein